MTEKKNSEGGTNGKRKRRHRSSIHRPRVSLERATFALCEAEFERIWGEPWHPRTGGAQHGAAAHFVRHAEAATARKRDADEAIKLYDSTREKLQRIAVPLRGFLGRKHANSPASMQLGALLGIIETEFPLVSDLADAMQNKYDLSDPQMGRRDGRAAFVSMYASRVHSWGPPVDPADQQSPRRLMTNREIAIVAILCGMRGLGEWSASATPRFTLASEVIHDEEKRVGAIRAALRHDQ